MLPGKITSLRDLRRSIIPRLAISLKLLANHFFCGDIAGGTTVICAQTTGISMNDRMFLKESIVPEKALTTS